MKKYDAAELLNKYRQGTCTPEEKALVESWLLQQLNNNKANLPDNLELTGKRIWEAMPVQEDKKARTLWVRYAAAAAVLLVIAVAGYFRLINKKSNQSQPVTAANNAVQDIAPGGNKAILTLGNGTHIILDTAKNGTVATQLQSTIHKQDGTLAYQRDAQAAAMSTTGPVQYNKLSVPRGGQYHIVLSDGTGVWLNALSTLHYPVAFTGDTREVELTGEGYFEVAKNKDMPFKVTTQQQQVQVLGTHFVINAYEDEPNIHTTLLEGAVTVTSAAHNKTIKPGQQTVLSRTTGIMKVQPADTAYALAWKNGYFRFKQDDIESVMRRIARWYDVDIQYEGEHTKQQFIGDISRFENASKVLRMLQLTGVVNFKVEGKKIIVQ